MASYYLENKNQLLNFPNILSQPPANLPKYRSGVGGHKKANQTLLFESESRDCPLGRVTGYEKAHR